MGKITSPTDCPFCRQNQLLKGEVIAETNGAYLIKASSSFGNFLIIPAGHTEQLSELPDNWWYDFKKLLAQIPDLASSYNVSLNFGKTAGQSVKHLHFWIIPRHEAHPSSGKGFVRLMNEADQVDQLS